MQTLTEAQARRDFEITFAGPFGESFFSDYRRMQRLQTGVVCVQLAVLAIGLLLPFVDPAVSMGHTVPFLALWCVALALWARKYQRPPRRYRVGRAYMVGVSDRAVWLKRR